MPPLPFKSVDTGKGVEGTAAVFGGFANTYPPPVFAPIIAKIEQVANQGGAGYRYGSDEAKDVATRIIADHIRTAVFCIADGVLPGNSGRGYVLRRLIRRAVLKGQRGLGIEQPFFHLVFEGVVESMGDHYTELHERRDIIVETLRNEEGLFRRTLSAGSQMLQQELDRLAKSSTKTISGESAFRLYDTYGFPLEVTKELAAEA